MPAQVIKTSGARQHNLENLRAEICFASFDASEAMSFELSLQFGLFSSNTDKNVQLNMNEREYGQLPLAKRTERWEQIRTAYVAGIGLREIARNMNIPEGTVLAHAKRHGWTQEIQAVTKEASREFKGLPRMP